MGPALDLALQDVPLALRVREHRLGLELAFVRRARDLGEDVGRAEVYPRTALWKVDA